MVYENITKAVFLARPNRFIAEVELNGHKERVHVKNTGRCRDPGMSSSRQRPVFFT